MRGLAILWVFGFAQVLSGTAIADGVGESARSSSGVPARACKQNCSPHCSTPITVNCQQAPLKSADPITSPSDSTKPKDDPTTKSPKDKSEIWTHVIDKIPEILWWVLAFTALFYYGQRWPTKLLGKLTKFKAGGVEFEFNAERAREAEADFHEALDSFKKLAQKEYDRQANAVRLGEWLLPNAVKAVLEKTTTPNVREKAHRATVYVPDVVFKRFLYQLLDYYPEGGGRGRRFSERYGIIGRCWRTSRSIGEGNAVRIGATPDPQVAIETLTREWGMTRSEAENTRRMRPSVLCILLFPDDASKVPVGMLFMDSELKDAFGAGDATTFAKSMEANGDIQALAKAVGKIMEDLLKGAAAIEVT